MAPRRGGSGWMDEPKSKSKKAITVDDVYTGVASFGLMMALIGAVIGGIIGFALMAYGIYLISNPGPSKIGTTATVVSSNCTQSGKTTSCNLKLSYKAANGSAMTATLMTSDGIHNTGDTINIQYDPVNPSDISQGTGGNSTMTGWILLIIGLIVAILSIGNYLLTKYSKAYAAFVGVDSGIDMVSGDMF